MHGAISGQRNESRINHLRMVEQHRAIARADPLALRSTKTHPAYLAPPFAYHPLLGANPLFCSDSTSIFGDPAAGVCWPLAWRGTRPFLWGTPAEAARPGFVFI